jgi:malonyl CoA-acyl carrier protein transacylase
VAARRATHTSHTTGGTNVTADVAIDEVGLQGVPGAVQHRRAPFRGWAPSPEDSFAAVAFFPGLGSRGAYRDVGVWSIGSELSVVEDLYREAADALEIATGPAGLALTADNLPSDPVERQGFIAAAFLVHNLAIYSDLRERAARSGHLRIAAYTGESFGMLASAVAAGALSVGDAARIARVFTPLLLAASNQRGRGEFGQSIERYLPRHSSDSPPVGEPFHVIGLRATPEALHRVTALLTQRHGEHVEVHKRYSRHQVNVYVRASFIPTFVPILRSYPEIEAKELKAPTTFLAHSRLMIGAREALARYLEDQQIGFTDPHTPLLSNSGHGFLITADHVRQAILAMTDVVMDSQRTVELIDELHPDLVLEVGRGGRSLQLLRDNTAQPQALTVADATESERLVAGADLVHELTRTTRALHARTDAGLTEADVATLRDLAGLSSREPAFDGYLRRRVCEMGFEAARHPERDQSPALRQFRETLQYTFAHRAHVRPGELVLGARLRKRLTGTGADVGRACTELQVLDTEGHVRVEEVEPAEDTEALVVHFEQIRRPATSRIVPVVRDLVTSQAIAQRIHDAVVEGRRDDGQDDGRQALDVVLARADAIDVLVHQLSMLALVRKHRPGFFEYNHVFIEASDPFGWLVGLVAARSAVPADVVDLATQLVLGRGHDRRTEELVDALCGRLADAEVPMLSLRGTPLLARRDLVAETTLLFARRKSRDARRPIRLDASCTVLALGHASRVSRLDAGPHGHRTLLVRSPEETWRHGLNLELDVAEARVLLTASPERRAITDYAQRRNLLHSTVSAYVHPDESVAGFGEGGSESMTIFFRRTGDPRLRVRKILSEALTTARWDPDGVGPMLPPFTKAKRQAEYLGSLPSNLRTFFPQVENLTERALRAVAPDGRDELRREVIYEMSYVPGVEVGQFVRDHAPSARVVARLYELILRFLHDHVHTERRGKAPGGTLEEQYFRKIEDRLDLCRATAPRTFDASLLDSDAITINGVRYRNVRPLLAAFRADPALQRMLEPPAHALVIGDTNTENIKIDDLGPLLRADELIAADADGSRIDRALRDITAQSIGLRFLDPRAIGYRSSGAETRDDPMYDNKPWHNSIGHYDEMHNELFDLEVRATADGSPSIDVAFHRDNPYARSYAVRDVTERGLAVDTDRPRGMEDHFAAVMRAVYDLDDPRSRHLREDPHWLVRFVFTMGTHFTAMPPFHFTSEVEGTLVDTPDVQRRPVAIYCEGIKWLNWALEMGEGRRSSFLGLDVAPTSRTAPSGPVAQPGAAVR